MATLEPAYNDEAALPVEAPPSALDSHSPLATLVRKLSDIVVLPATRLSSNERSLTADLLMHVVVEAPADLRREVAVRLSRIMDCPPALTRILLIDEASVAEPLIRGAAKIPESLLIECARTRTTAHRALIARRQDLTSSVADVLLESGEPEIAKLLLRREEFQLSPTAVDALVSRSAGDKELQGLLLRRREIEPAHGFIMFWWVDAERRKRILTRFSLDRTMIQDAVEDLYPRVFRGEGAENYVKEILTILERRHRPRGLNGEPVAMNIVMRTIAGARRFPNQEMVQAISLVAGVSLELSGRILRDPGGEPLAVMCKAVGMPRDEFFQIAQDSRAETPLDGVKAEELLGVFDSMSRDFARAVLRYWDWDGNPRIASIMRQLDADEPPTRAAP